MQERKNATLKVVDRLQSVSSFDIAKVRELFDVWPNVRRS